MWSTSNWTQAWRVSVSSVITMDGEKGNNDRESVVNCKDEHAREARRKRQTAYYERHAKIIRERQRSYDKKIREEKRANNKITTCNTGKGFVQDKLPITKNTELKFVTDKQLTTSNTQTKFVQDKQPMMSNTGLKFVPDMQLITSNNRQNSLKTSSL